DGLPAEREVIGEPRVGLGEEPPTVRGRGAGAEPTVLDRSRPFAHDVGDRRAEEEGDGDEGYPAAPSVDTRRRAAGSFVFCSFDGGRRCHGLRTGSRGTG